MAALYFVGKLVLLAAGAALFGRPSWDGLVDALGSADLSPARSAAAALAPTAVFLVLCLIPR
ncbi:hypothetical protein ACFU6K_37935 [Kitasatospora sp. NPDC057512]|uniref:hypothetical protein n=1 Tax=Kitasatospora sp. NPDC057512 TaxID=3346154 RepID=UPI0036C02318